MSKLETLLEFDLKAQKITGYEREYRFHPVRRWRFDFAWPALKVAVEVNGVTYYGKNKDGSMRLGRHQTAKGYKEDCKKIGGAMMLGWDVYPCTGELIKDGTAIETIKVLLALAEKTKPVSSELPTLIRPKK